MCKDLWQVIVVTRCAHSEDVGLFLYEVTFEKEEGPDVFRTRKRYIITTTMGGGRFDLLTEHSYLEINSLHIKFEYALKEYNRVVEIMKKGG